MGQKWMSPRLRPSWLWRVSLALDGTEVDVPQVETILAVESVPRYRTLTRKLEEYPAEVECGHLEEQVESLLQEGVACYTWF